MTSTHRDTLLSLLDTAISAVKGDSSVRTWLVENALSRPTHIIAVGKAARAMFEGLPQDWQQNIPTFLVTKTAHLAGFKAGSNVTALETSHPIPDQSSLAAGKAALDFVAACPAESQLLMLVSGGASSLVEHLQPGVDLEHLSALTHDALAEGADIAAINARRRAVSAIKGGGLLAAFGGARADVLAISDVEGDSISVIGSGIGAAPAQFEFIYNCAVVASNALARTAVVQAAEALGISVVHDTETLYADVGEAAKQIAHDVTNGADGLYVYGGEPTVVLPPNPGLGGRNQALALEVAGYIHGRVDVVGLVAGTDGTDGPTDAAGGFVDGATFNETDAAEQALAAADAGSYLASVGDQIITGPTGTNVMDVAIFIKQSHDTNG